MAQLILDISVSLDGFHIVDPPVKLRTTRVIESPTGTTHFRYGFAK